MGKTTNKDDIPLREYLIERVKAHPAIWDNSHKEDVKANLITSAWLKILTDLKTEFGEEELNKKSMGQLKQIKAVWQNLCRQFRCLKGQTVGKSGAGAAEVINPGSITWPFYQQVRKQVLQCSNYYSHMYYTPRR